jgi:hypothetical protein
MTMQTKKIKLDVSKSNTTLTLKSGFAALGSVTVSSYDGKKFNYMVQQANIAKKKYTLKVPPTSTHISVSGNIAPLPGKNESVLYLTFTDKGEDLEYQITESSFTVIFELN